MPPTRSSPHPIYVSTELANIPFRFRRKSLSEDDLPNPDYYLVPPSPSLSPSRSFSMSSSPPSSPTTLNTSPTRPHLDTASIRPPSSPTHPTPYHAYGYAYTYSRGMSHPGPSDHDLLPAEPKRVPPNSRSHHPIIPPANPIRSTFSPLPADRHSLRASFSSVSQNAPVHDEEEDDIEDCGFALDLDDILAGSSPTRRISFTTSSERDRPFARPVVKPRLSRSRPFTTTSSSATPTELSTRPQEVQCDSTRTSVAPLDVPPPLACPLTPIRPRSVVRHVAASPPPSAGENATTAKSNSDLDDTLPPSSPIPPSPVSSPFRTPSAPRPSGSDPRCYSGPRLGPGSGRSHTVRSDDLHQLELDLGSDLTLPPSSPIRVPSTPAPYAAGTRDNNVDCMDLDVDTDLDLADLVASPPSPTLDALRITSRVAVRALLNPAPAPVPQAAAVPDDDDDVLPQLDALVDDETETQVEAEVGGEETDGKMEVVILSIPDGDVTPLVLPELDASEELVLPAEADAGVPSDDLNANTTDVGEEAMATEIREQIADPERESTPTPQRERERELTPKLILQHQLAPEPEACPVPTTLTITTVPAEAKSRRSSRAPSESRARTPHAEAAQSPSRHCQATQIPSSPLSPTPSSIADADVDIDIEMGLGMDCVDELPALAVPDPVSSPVSRQSRSRSSVSSRAPSPAPVAPVHAEAKAKVDDAVEPPRKKMRREADADVSHAKAASKPAPKVKTKAKRARTPTFTDSESEREPVVKPRKQTADPERTKSNTKLARLHHRKRPRAVLSDEESESDSPAAPAPPPVRASAPSLPLPLKKRDGGLGDKERKKEKPKRQRAKAKAKDPQTDLELENEPLHPHASTSSDLGHAKQQQPAKSSSLSVSASPPKSATNFARPELPLPAPPVFDAHGHGSQTKPPKPPRPAQDPDPDRTSTDAASVKPKPKLSATSSPTSTSTATSPGKSKAPRSRPDAEQIAAEADALVAAFELPLPAGELEGMLIETLATARASSLATSALFGALMASRPALRDMPLPALKAVHGDAKVEDGDAAEKDGGDAKAQSKGRGAGASVKADTAGRRAWVPALEAVLEAGWRRSGVFGKIVNSGTDLANHALALEARWFYDPDQDADADRAALVRTMMRRPGQRSEARKAKHYYWRPLPKISRWDDEDEL